MWWVGVAWGGWEGTLMVPERINFACPSSAAVITTAAASCQALQMQHPPSPPPSTPPHPHLKASIPSSRECDRDADPSQRGRIISRRPASMGHRDHSKPTDSSVNGLAGVTLCRPLWSMLRSQNFLLESAFSTCPSFKRARLWPQKVCWNIKIITDSE